MAFLRLSWIFFMLLCFLPGNGNRDNVREITRDMFTSDIASSKSGSYETTVAVATDPYLETTVMTTTEEHILLSSLCKGNRTGNLDAYIDLTVQDMLPIFFDFEKIYRLIGKCESGEWCLDPDTAWQDTTTDLLGLCVFNGCLENIPYRLMTKDISILMTSLKMLCESQRLNKSQQCQNAVRKISHVTLADQYREDDEKGSTCTPGIQQETCGGPCANLARNIQCVQAECEDDTNLFLWVPWWQWYFTNNKDVSCSKAEDCSYYEAANTNWITTFWQESSKLLDVEDMDFKVVSGIFTLGVVVAAASIIIVWVCIKRTRKRRQYVRDFGEYSELKTTDATDLFSVDDKEYIQLT